MFCLLQLSYLLSCVGESKHTINKMLWANTDDKLNNLNRLSWWPHFVGISHNCNGISDRWPFFSPTRATFDRLHNHYISGSPLTLITTQIGSGSYIKQPLEWGGDKWSNIIITKCVNLFSSHKDQWQMQKYLSHLIVGRYKLYHTGL